MKQILSSFPKEGVEGVILLSGLLPANAEVNLDEDENAADYFRINTIGTINVLEYCRKNGIKRVISNCSYADVRGAWGKKVITEDEPRDLSIRAIMPFMYSQRMRQTIRWSITTSNMV